MVVEEIAGRRSISKAWLAFLTQKAERDQKLPVGFASVDVEFPSPT